MARLSVAVTLTVDEVCRIHQRLCEDFFATEDPIDPPGIRSQALLESAVGRQEAGWGKQRKYGRALASAATLTYGLCQDHAFHNGNKRTALVAMLAHLDRNRIALHSTRQADLFSLMLDIAQSRVSLRNRSRRSTRPPARPSADEEVEAIVNWLSRRTHRVVRGERDMTFKQLRQVLREFGFDLENPHNNSIDVVRVTQVKKGVLRQRDVEQRKRIGNIGYPGETRMTGLQRIKQVRRMCGLTEADGVDSSSFYEGADVVDVFINEYRTVLRRLARR